MADSKRGQDGVRGPRSAGASASAGPELATRPQPPATRPETEPGDLYEDEGPESETIVSVFGTSERKGDWEPPDITHVFTMCGNSNLDFTRALLPPGVTEVHALSFLGDTKIVVPEGLEVEVTGTGVLGDFRQTAKGMGAAKRALRRTIRAAVGENEDDDLPDEDAPTLKISGLAILGSVRIITR